MRGVLLAVAFATVLLAIGLGQAAAPAAAEAACKNADAVARSVPAKAAGKAIQCLINRARASRGLRKLKNNKALRKAATKHSRYEDKTNCISHRCPGEPDLSRRLAKAGYPGCSCRWSAGEVIGWRRNDAATARGIVDAWLASSAHRANLLDRSHREIGVGVVWGSPRAGAGKRAIAGIFTVNVGSRKPF